MSIRNEASPDVARIRVLSAGLAAIVLFDAAMLRAPGLGLLALPFITAAIGLRQGRTLSMVLMALLGALYAFIGGSYAVANGVSVGVGDLFFAYVGTPVAVAITALAMRQATHRGPRAVAT